MAILKAVEGTSEQELSIIFSYLSGLLLHDLIPVSITRTKKKSFCVSKPTLILTDNDNSNSDTADNLAIAEYAESEDVLSQEKEACQEYCVC